MTEIPFSVYLIFIIIIAVYYAIIIMIRAINASIKRAKAIDVKISTQNHMMTALEQKKDVEIYIKAEVAKMEVRNE